MTDKELSENIDKLNEMLEQASPKRKKYTNTKQPNLVSREPRELEITWNNEKVVIERYSV